MGRKDKSVRNNDTLPPPRRKHNHLRNIIRRQRIHPLVNLIRLRLIPIKPHHAELCLHLTRINLNDSYPCRNQFFPESGGESAHGGLGRAVDAAAGVAFPTGNRADVYDVAGAAVGACFVDFHDFLGESYEAGDVRGEHDGDVFSGYVGGLGDAFDEAAVSNYQLVV